MDSHLLAHPDVRVLLYSFLLLLGIYVSVMYTCWGTVSLSKVKAEFKERQDLERAYEATLQRREDMLYHIGGAQQRGEHQQAAVLDKQLLRVDGDLDLIEERLRDLDARHRSKRPKLKM
ncbi:unnamed protein product [Ectocarpus sp. CCAP 1310/34]|nr:unnamed protein product [Ectocarpus sp. CCAP 1310/34]